jgi:hypothetical protein
MWDGTKHKVTLTKEDVQREIKKLVRKKMAKFFPGAKLSQVKVDIEFNSLTIKYHDGTNEHALRGCNVRSISVQVTPGR